VWPRLDRLWIFAAENVTQALVDLIAGAKASAINAPTFVPDKGFVFDGSTQYIDTGFNAVQEPSSIYSLNSASFGGYVFAPGTRRGGVEFGNDFSAYSMLMTNYGAIRRFQVNAVTDSAGIPVNESLTGHFHGQRTGEAQSELFLDGVSQGQSTVRSGRVHNATFFVGAGRGGSGPSNHSTASISTAHIGGHLSPVQVLLFDKAVRSYFDVLRTASHGTGAQLSATA
jgi:hypothetical protein